MIQCAWLSYIDTRFCDRSRPARDALDRTTSRLLLMLMLARIDGKSPAEYLSEDQRRHVRTFAVNSLLSGLASLDDVTRAWFEALPRTTPAAGSESAA